LDQDFEIGEVVEIKGDRAGIELVESNNCHSCGARMICRPGDSGKRILYLKNTLNTQIGDRILIEQSDKNQLKLAFMQYGLPLLSFLLAVLVANYLIFGSYLGIPSDILQFGIGLVVLAIAGLISRSWAKRKAAGGFSVFSMKEICK